MSNNNNNSKNEKDTDKVSKVEDKMFGKVAETLNEKTTMKTGSDYNKNPFNWFIGKLVLVGSVFIVATVLQFLLSGSLKTVGYAMFAILAVLAVLTILAKKLKDKDDEEQEKQKAIQLQVKKHEELAQKVLDDFNAGIYYKAKADSDRKLVEVIQTSEGNWKLVYKDKLVDNFSYEKEMPIK